ncbi:MAG: lycopene cyclase domain-containing protein [Candidatus Dormibacter sp.]|uniref:lycopene cyclase domain-containing protein n=1 Tax=Candidatus Dormibacter sp. TaxID=2973982 RepID=UPI002690BDEE
MREYTLASLGLLLVAAVLAAVTGSWRRPAFWAGIVVFGLLTAAFDLLMTSEGLYHYADRYRSGVGIGRMPVEDLLYGLALYAVAVSAWCGRHAES